MWIGKRQLSLATSVALALFAGACSCGSPGTTKQTAALKSNLEKDKSGKADYLVDFGVVALGDRKTIRARISNEGNTELVLFGEALGIPFAHELPGGGLTIGVGEERALALVFEPLEETAEPIETIFKLQTNESNGREYSIRMLGHGKRASLECDPGELVFGPVPKGSSKTLSVTCTNPLPIPIEVQAEEVKGNYAQFFSARLEGAPDGWTWVEGGGAITISLTFRAESVGRNDAELELIDAFNEPLAFVPLVADAMDSTIAVEPQPCLDFSYVQVGSSERKSLRLRTIGDKDVQILRLELPEEARNNFTLHTRAPITLTPGGAERSVEIEFHPGASGPAKTSIGIHTSESMVTACIQGFGGGPAISCTPASIDFQMAAVGMPVRRTYDCINDGTPVPGMPIDPLVITRIESTASEFVPKIINRDRSEGAKRGGYPLEDGFKVEVEYGPTEERFDSGTIRLLTKSAPGGAHETAVSGEGRNLPPCDFELSPPLLRFGIVDRGESLTLAFGIKNHGDFSCLINDMHLAEGSDPAYRMEPIANHELLAGESLEVAVTFSPKAYRASFLGGVEFQISNPDRMNQRVELRGTSQEPCIAVEPKEVDFGAVSPGCQTKPLWVLISNLCGVPVTVSAATVEEGLHSGVFQIARRPTLPRTLHPNEREEFTMVFSPTEIGSYRGALLVEVDDSEPYVASMKGLAEPSPIQTDVFDQKARPKVDILWVMDNSGSFSVYQERVAENLPSFLTAANEKNVDYRIAVTTSGLTKMSSGCPGGAKGGEDGRFFPVDGSHPRILTPTTPNLEEHWAHNMKVGTCHGVEPYLEAAYRALSPPLIEETKSSKHFHDNPYNDGNAGFLRREASLSIIFVADERDQSTAFGREVEDYLAFFKSLKGHNMFRAHAISGARSGSNFRCRVEEGDRILDLVDDTGGTWLDICTPTNNAAAWEAGLATMSEGAFGFTARFILRGVPGPASGNANREVNEDDIELHVNGHLQPARTTTGQMRWTFDPISNAIDFSPLFIPADGSQITATYHVACIRP